MPNTALNRTTQTLMTNKSGGSVAYGGVVIVDTTTDSSFTTTTTSGLSTSQVGVVLEPNGIASNALGIVAVGGWCPRITLNTASTRGQFIKTHTVAGQGTPHSSPQVEGDFAVALEASTTPACNLFGSPNGPLAGGSGTVTHTAGALTANAVVVGNASADITVLASLGTADQVLTSAGAGTPPVFAAGGLTKIQEQTPTGVGTVTFSSLGSYTHLRLIWTVRGTTASTLVGINLRLNGDTGANYDTEFITGVGAAASAAETLAQTSAGLGNVSGSTATAGLCAVGELFIADYAGTTFHKGGVADFSYKAANTAGNTYRQTSGFSWRNTAAVTSVTVFLASGNYDTGSKLSLYGLK